MSRLHGGFLLVLTAALVTAAAVIVCLPRADRVAPFQKALGSLGLSSAVSVDWSFFGFDPRIEPACENELWPIPGLHCPNPSHGASVADFPPVEAFVVD